MSYFGEGGWWWEAGFFGGIMVGTVSTQSRLGFRFPVSRLHDSRII